MTRYFILLHFLLITFILHGLRCKLTFIQTWTLMLSNFNLILFPNDDICSEMFKYSHILSLFCNLWQENYINYRPSSAVKDDSGIKRMNLIARAAESIGNGDIFNVQIRKYRQWQLSQSACLSSSIFPYVS